MGERSEPLQVSDTVPTFTLPTQDGSPFTFDTPRENYTLLYFMRDYTCAMCRNNIAEMIRHYDQLQERNVDVLVFGTGSKRGAEQLAQVYKPSFHILADNDRDVYKAFGIHKVLLLQRNATLLVDGEGVVRYVSQSPIPGSSFDIVDVNAALDEINGIVASE